MGLDPFTWAAIASAVVGTASVVEAKSARKQAASDAAAEREKLAALQAVPEPVVPTVDDESVKKARQRSIAAQLRRRGRESTVITGGDSADSLGA